MRLKVLPDSVTLADQIVLVEPEEVVNLKLFIMVAIFKEKLLDSFLPRLNVDILLCRVSSTGVEEAGAGLSGHDTLAKLFIINGVHLEPLGEPVPSLDCQVLGQFTR